MAFIRVLEIQGKKNRKRLRECECDQCKKIFTKIFYKNRCDDRLTFCSVKCANKSRKDEGLIRKKWKCTIKERYGEDNPFKVEKFLEKRKETYTKRYGVDNPGKIKSLWEKSQRKKHETMKRRGLYVGSMIEDKFYIFLCEKFGKDNVKRHITLNEWDIDFYVSTIDTYIQFDGVYWHGLNRSIDEIKQFKSPRDNIIYKTYLRDQKQNAWFKKNNLKLIRVTDTDFNKSLKNQQSYTL